MPKAWMPFIRRSTSGGGGRLGPVRDRAFASLGRLSATGVCGSFVRRARVKAASRTENRRRAITDHDPEDTLDTQGCTAGSILYGENP